MHAANARAGSLGAVGCARFHPRRSELHRSTSRGERLLRFYRPRVEVARSAGKSCATHRGESAMMRASLPSANVMT